MTAKNNFEALPDKFSITKEELCQLLFENLPVGLMAVDKDCRIIEFNPAAEQITGYSRNEVLGKKCKEILKTCLCGTNAPINDEGKMLKTPLLAQKGILHTKSGATLPILFTYAPLRDEKGEVKGAIEMFRDYSEAERLEKQRNILISMFAHDLKAPLAIAGGFLARLLSGKPSPLSKKQKQYVDAAYKEIKKLDSYIREFLDILRLEAGKVPLSIEKCSVDKALYEMTEAFKVEAAEKGITIETDIPDHLPLVEVDKEKLQRAVANLLDNAIKYSPPDSKIIVRAWETEDELVFEIQDFGKGIRKEDLPHVFDPFYRGRNVKQGKVQNEGGSGLGLAIVKSIIEAHGGQIWIESEVGKGTIIRFTIPKKNSKREVKPKTDHGNRSKG